MRHFVYRETFVSLTLRTLAAAAAIIAAHPAVLGAGVARGPIGLCLIIAVFGLALIGSQMTQARLRPGDYGVSGVWEGLEGLLWYLTVLPVLLVFGLTMASVAMSLAGYTLALPGGVSTDDAAIGALMLTGVTGAVGLGLHGLRLLIR